MQDQNCFGHDNPIPSCQPIVFHFQYAFDLLLPRNLSASTLGKQGDFLGQASLGWQDLDLLPGEACREIDLPLGPQDGVTARHSGLVQGSIQLLVAAPVVEVRLRKISLGWGGGAG